MFVALEELLLAFELLVVVVLHADGAADVVDDILIGSGVVASGRFVADAVCGLPIGIDVAARHRGAGLSVLCVLLQQLASSRSRGGRRAIQIE